MAWTTLGYFLAWGFFAGFLATRLWLLGELTRADRIQDLQGRLKVEEQDHEVAAERAKAAEEKLTAVADASVHVLEVARAAMPTGRAAAAVADEGRSAPDPTRARKTVESLVFSALYQAAPDGFRKAIATADEYLKAHDDEVQANADLNMYLACAHGQAHAYEKAHAARTEGLREHRLGALEAARAAIAGAPETKNLLRTFLHASPGQIDNDLASFGGDAEFEQLLAETVE